MLASKIAQTTFDACERLFGSANVATVITRDRFGAMMVHLHYVLDPQDSFCDEAFSLLSFD